jgi:hypothetical protein
MIMVVYLQFGFLQVVDGDPAYPPCWTKSEHLRGGFVIVKGGKDLQITSGWEKAVEFPRATGPGVIPDVTAADFSSFDSKTSGRKKDLITLAELKTLDEFAIYGQYVKPINFKKAKPAAKKKSSKSKKVEEDDSDDDNDDVPLAAAGKKKQKTK